MGLVTLMSAPQHPFAVQPCAQLLQLSIAVSLHPQTAGRWLKVEGVTLEMLFPHLPYLHRMLWQSRPSGYVHVWSGSGSVRQFQMGIPIRQTRAPYGPKTPHAPHPARHAVDQPMCAPMHEW